MSNLVGGGGKNRGISQRRYGVAGWEKITGERGRGKVSYQTNANRTKK